MGNSYSHRLPTPLEAEQLRTQREKKLEMRKEKKLTKRASTELANIRKAMKAGKSEIVVKYDHQKPALFRQACEGLIPVLAVNGFSAELVGSSFRWKPMEPPLPRYAECTCCLEPAC